jgi:hypothetical protein
MCTWLSVGGLFYTQLKQHPEGLILSSFISRAVVPEGNEEFFDFLNCWFHDRKSCRALPINVVFYSVSMPWNHFTAGERCVAIFCTYVRCDVCKAQWLCDDNETNFLHRLETRFDMRLQWRLLNKQSRTVDMGRSSSLVGQGAVTIDRKGAACYEMLHRASV